MTEPVALEPEGSPEGIPPPLLAQLAGGQRQITGLLVEMGGLLARLAEASDAHNARMASLDTLPVDPEMAAKVVADPRQLAGGLDLTDEERQAFLDALESRREGGTYADGWRAAVAALRDDERYQHWWTACDYPPGERYWGSVPRNHLADYLHTVGPDGPEVTRG